MPESRLFAAAGTPLTPDEQLHEAGLSLQLDRLQSAGLAGVLIAGTFGAIQMLSDRTYRQLVEQSAQLRRPGSEMMIGISDMGLTRTRQRLSWVNRFAFDGVVALPPHFLAFRQEELIAYYRTLADESRAALYLYDLPQRTHIELELSTIVALAEHPNIAGIKCSSSADKARQIMQALPDSDFRVFVAAPDRLGQLVAEGQFVDHLDGIYALAPHWSMSVVRAAQRGDTDAMQQGQNQLLQLRDALRKHGGMSALTVLMNNAGIPGNFAPAPFLPPTRTQKNALLDTPVIRRLLAGNPEPALGS